MVSHASVSDLVMVGMQWEHANRMGVTISDLKGYSEEDLGALGIGLGELAAAGLDNTYLTRSGPAHGWTYARLHALEPDWTTLSTTLRFNTAAVPALTDASELPTLFASTICAITPQEPASPDWIARMRTRLGGGLGGVGLVPMASLLGSIPEGEEVEPVAAEPVPGSGRAGTAEPAASTEAVDADRPKPKRAWWGGRAAAPDPDTPPEDLVAPDRAVPGRRRCV